MSEKNLDMLEFVTSSSFDIFNRPVVTIFGCNIPGPDKFTKEEVVGHIRGYIDRVSHAEYTVVLFLNGFKSKESVTYNYIYTLHSNLVKSTRKNIKALYVIHPTKWFRFFLSFSTMFLSPKFYKKLNYIYKISELNKHLSQPMTNIPEAILQYDHELNKGDDAHSGYIGMVGSSTDSVMGVSTSKLIKGSDVNTLPNFLTSCIELIRRKGISSPNIFRISPNIAELNEFACTVDKNFDFSNTSVTIAASFLKRYLRSLPSPLLGEQSWNLVRKFELNQDGLDEEIQNMIKSTPAQDQQLFKLICDLARKIDENSSVNNMSFSNLAIVLSPNIFWGNSESDSLLSDAHKGKVLLEYIFNNYQKFY